MNNSRPTRSTYSSSPEENMHPDSRFTRTALALDETRWRIAKAIDASLSYYVDGQYHKASTSLNEVVAQTTVLAAQAQTLQSAYASLSEREAIRHGRRNVA